MKHGSFARSAVRCLAAAGALLGVFTVSVASTLEHYAARRPLGTAPNWVSGRALDPECGDSNNDGVVDWRDFPDYFNKKPGKPTLIDADDIVEIANEMKGECPEMPCNGLAAGISDVFQRELGRLPTVPELEPFDGSPTDPCTPPEEVEPMPGGEGPIYCNGVAPTSPGPNPCQINPASPGQRCTEPDCLDIIICLGESCDDPPDRLDIPLHRPANPGLPTTIPHPGEGDPHYPSNPWFPPGQEPSDDAAEPQTQQDEYYLNVDPMPPHDDGEAESDDRAERPDDDDKTPEPCDTDPSGSGESDSSARPGPNPTTMSPVNLLTGTKVEGITDIAVRVKGQDFKIERFYSSETAFGGPDLVGSQWDISCFRYLKIQDTVMYAVGPNRGRQITPCPSNGDGTYSPAGPSRQTISPTTIPETSINAWLQEEPGVRQTYYFRGGNTARDGLLAYEADFYGNTITYHYEQYGTTDPKARLQRIELNSADPTYPNAEIRFQWVLVVGDEEHPLNGKLARVQVIRFSSTGVESETDRVEYTYKHSYDGFSADLGTDGDLIQVTSFRRIDAVQADGGSYTPGYPARTSVTQYRYHNGIAAGSGDPRLEVIGAAHQLKLVVRPVQMEYYAQKLHRGGALQHPSVAVRDAAWRLMLRNDDDLAFRDEASQNYKVIDLAGKIVGYNLTSGRVEKQYLQSSCGCSGGVTQGIEQTYAYVEWGTGRSTSITEKLFDDTDYDTLFRTLYYDMEVPNSHTAVHYLKYVAMKAPNNDTWAWRYTYNDDRELVTKVTPSAASVYTPASTGNAPTLTTHAGAGLVIHYAYSADHRVTETSVAQGTSGNPILVSKVYYGTDGVTGERSYLRKKIERFADAGTSDQNKIETTWYQYGFRDVGTSPSHQVAWVREIREAELPEENGPASTDPGARTYDGHIVYDTYRLYNARGQEEWTRLADWSLIKLEYDSTTGALTSRTANASPSTLDGSDYAGISTTGWGYENGGSTQVVQGGELTWQFGRDTLGRVTEQTFPSGVRRLYRREYRSLALAGVNELPGIYYYTKVVLPHKFGSSFDGPASLAWFDASGKKVSQVEYSLNASGDYEPYNSATLLDDVVARKSASYKLSGLLDRARVWHDVAGGASSGYYDTLRTYDERGRTSTVTHPNGSVITIDSYDAFDRALSMSVGRVGETSVQVAAWFYDDPNADSTPEQGVGNGNQSWAVLYVGEDGTSADDPGTPGDDSITSSERRVYRTFDFRDRVTTEQGPEAPHHVYVYDNLGRLAETGTFSQIPSGMSATDRGLYAKQFYSQRGLRYRNAVAIDASQSSPTYLESNIWYNPDGRVIASLEPGTAAVKTLLDGHGRSMTTWVTDRYGDPLPGATGTYAAAISISDDRVLEQTQFHYDSAGNADFVTHRVRNHDDTTTGGSLTDSISVVQYAGNLFDAANRPIRQVNFGTNTTDFRSGGSAPTWPPSGGTVPDWNTSGWENTIISAVEYHPVRGIPEISVNPLGRKSKIYTDDLERVIASVENYEDATVSWSSGRWVASGLGSGTDESVDRVTSYVIDGANNITHQVAHLPGSGGAEKVQITEYEYGTTVGSASNDLHSLVALGNLISEVHFPDSSTGNPGGTGFTVAFAYNRLGEVRSMKDQNGTLHRYDRDLRGRVITDRIPSGGFGTGIDTWMNQIKAVYDRLDRLSKVDSLNDTTVLNEVEFTYNSLWQLDRVFQDHNGVVQRSGNTPSGDTRAIAHAYTTSNSTASNYSRPSTLTYPDGSVQTYGYGSTGTIDDRISRPVSVSVNNLSSFVTSLATYKYVGLGMDAVVDYPLPNVQLDRTFTHDGKRNSQGYSTQNDGVYPGWDRFGRVINQAWVDGALTVHSSLTSVPNRPPLLEEISTYDRMSNRTARYDRRPGVHLGNRDFEFTYDGLDRLIKAEQGVRVDASTWNRGKGAQEWALDMLGNMSAVKTDADGNSTYAGTEIDTRDLSNFANQIESRTLTGVSPAWPLAYDASGNLSAAQQSATLTANYFHDAWGRLVRVRNDTNSGGSISQYDLARCEYNGLHMRTVKRTDTSVPANGTLDQERRFYYSAEWQLIQEEIDDAFTGTTATDKRSQQFWGLRYVDDAVMRRTDKTANGSYLDSGDRTDYYITDTQFSPVALIDQSAKLVERVTYSAYGVPTFRWPGDVDGDGDADATDKTLITLTSGGGIGVTGYKADYDINRDGSVNSTDANLCVAHAALAAGLISDPSGPDSPIGFSGYVFTSEARLYCVRHRHYDPVLAVWLERDPAGYVDGMNLYGYVGNGPTNYLDPSGLAAQGKGKRASNNPEDQHRVYCEGLKERYEKQTKNANGEALCKSRFEELWKAGGCDKTIDQEIAEATVEGFLIGGHDGWIQTSYTALDTLTLGIFGLGDLPAEQGWLIDPDNPYLEGSKIAGRIAGEALGLALSLGRAGINPCLIGCFEAGTVVATPDGLVPIEELSVGDRVSVSPLPEGTSDNITIGDTKAFEELLYGPNGPMSCPESWRVVELVLPLPEGGSDGVRINLLRTVSWLEEQETWSEGAGGPHQTRQRGVAVGRHVYTVLPEMVIAGWAKVVSIKPCPEIKPGEGKVITGTFRTPNRPLVEVRVVGVPTAIRCTSGHPFLSLDRQSFVHAADLKPGERLITLAGDEDASGSKVGIAFVESVEAAESRFANRRAMVYNFEVGGVHRYGVTDAEVVVHNAGGCQGGVYALVAKNGTIVRVGRTNNFARREAEHLRQFEGLTFKRLAETNNRSAARGLEQHYHDLYSPILNKINPISPINPLRGHYLREADRFLRGLP